MTQNNINTLMKEQIPFILLNTESKTPTYRMLVQTGKELPAHDMGYDKLRYNPETIKSKIKQLEGRFVYDETQTAHNKRTTSESRGHKFAKITKTGYCPEYGGYADLKVFDKNYHDLMKEAYHSIKDGLPLHEGPSTELTVNKAQTYDDNNLDVVDWDYTGIVWDNNPRDNTLGVCKVLNSIKEIMEEPTMVDEIKLSKDEYDELIQVKQDKLKLESEFETLQGKYSEGEQLYNQGKAQFDELKTEKEALYNQLVPVWNAQGEQKMGMVNSILETIPEADREAKKADLEKLDTTTLGVIVNSLPPEGGPRGIQDGAQGGKPEDEDEKFTNEKYLEICEKHGIKP